MQLRVVFLGTSASVPTKSRSHTSIAVQRGGEVLLFDAGEGVQRTLGNVGLGYGRLTKIFISHLHGDHCVGLLGLLQTMSMVDREAPLGVYGPLGVKQFIDVNREIMGFGLTFKLEVEEVGEGLVVSGDGYDVFSCYGEHSTLNLAYVLQEHDRPGVFYPRKAIRLGVPEGKLWSRLQRGEKVKVDGKVILPEQVMGPKRRSRKIGFSGDTRPTEKLRRFFQDCDLLVFDSTFGDNLVKEASIAFHSTAREAARLAAESSVKQLVLTHISPRYKDTNTLLQEALEEHPTVQVASDLMVLNIPYS